MMKGLIQLFLSGALLFTVSPVFAQQSAPQEPAEQAEQSGQDEQAPSAESEQDERPDIDSQPIQRAEGEAPGRFIPSEQISQDLGVSFPVDI